MQTRHHNNQCLMYHCTELIQTDIAIHVYVYSHKGQ